jgi:hypothetical protein
LERWLPIEDLHIHDFSGLLLDMGAGELVTAEHELAKPQSNFAQAKYIFDRATPVQREDLQPHCRNED